MRCGRRGSERGEEVKKTGERGIRYVEGENTRGNEMADGRDEQQEQRGIVVRKRGIS